MPALVASIFVISGVMKLAKAKPTVKTFNEMGYPQWFLHVIGVGEIAGASLLAIPATASVGVSLLGLILIGAVISHLKTGGQAAQAMIPAAVMVMLPAALQQSREGRSLDTKIRS